MSEGAGDKLNESVDKAGEGAASFGFTDPDATPISVGTICNSDADPALTPTQDDVVPVKRPSNPRFSSECRVSTLPLVLTYCSCRGQHSTDHIKLQTGQGLIFSPPHSLSVNPHRSHVL